MTAIENTQREALDTARPALLVGVFLIAIKSHNTELGRVMLALTPRNRGKEAKIKVSGGCTWG